MCAALNAYGKAVIEKQTLWGALTDICEAMYAARNAYGKAVVEKQTLWGNLTELLAELAECSPLVVGHPVHHCPRRGRSNVRCSKRL